MSEFQPVEIDVTNQEATASAGRRIASGVVILAGVVGAGLLALNAEGADRLPAGADTEVNDEGCKTGGPGEPSPTTNPIDGPTSTVASTVPVNCETTTTAAPTTSTTEQVTTSSTSTPASSTTLPGTTTTVTSAPPNMPPIIVEVPGTTEPATSDSVPEME